MSTSHMEALDRLADQADRGRWLPWSQAGKGKSENIAAIIEKTGEIYLLTWVEGTNLRPGGHWADIDGPHGYYEPNVPFTHFLMFPRLAK